MTNVKVTVFWNATPYTLAICYRRFRRAAAYFAISSVHLPLSPVCLISAVQGVRLSDPYSHHDRKVLWLTDVEEGHWFGIMSNSMISVPGSITSTKLISKSQQIHETVKSFSINWNGTSNRRLNYRGCRGCSHGTASICRVKGAPCKENVWEPQHAHATVSGCKSFL